MKKLILSIVIPTYNRSNYLKKTLNYFSCQVHRNLNHVNLTVCNNASTDDTNKVLESLYKKDGFFEYKTFNTHVSIGDSISRANETANGDFVLMWGDDDIPSPFLVDYLLYIIEKYHNIGIFHFNRLEGKDHHAKGITNLSVLKRGYGYEIIEYDSVKKFLNEYILDVTFLSSVMFKKEYWIRNKGLDCSKHYGYEFLGHIFGNMKNEHLIYIQYPLCIQRHPLKRTWLNKSPLYRFIGIPNMYNDFEKWGLIYSAKKLWMSTANSFHSFLRIMPQASMYKKEYKPIIKEINSHQYSYFRKFLTYFFIYILPGCIYKSIRSSAFKFKRQM
jgi:glycosyltransferase involved in cell wall biosynthesis